MKKIYQNCYSLFFVFQVLVIFLSLSSCSKDDPKPTTGTISGKVTDVITSAELPEAKVIVFSASDQSPVSTATTNADGDYSVKVPGGNYFLKFYKQGYESVPPRGMEAIPFEVVVGQTSTQDAQMTASSVTNAGYITGKVSSGSEGMAGVLVTAEGNEAAYSAVSDTDGNYTIFNVAAGTYEVKGWIAEYSSSLAPASVTSNTATNNVNVTLTNDAAGTVSGSFKVISQTSITTPPTTMDIALLHPITRETVPGLSQNVPYASSLNYSFSDVPDGTYIVRATFSNDYIVIDPDYIVKFGDYTVTVTSGTASPSPLDIVSTSAVTLTSPTNAMTTTVPVVSSATPTFQWAAYPSTSDYVIEVTDASTGNVVWGGFTNNGGTLTKNITIPSNTTTIAYNSDGTATSQLIPGKIYRWRVFASKNNNQTNSWNLISMSEDQMGLIKIE
jgi:hypothetical protein